VSTLYFHSEHNKAEVSGAEYHSFRSLVKCAAFGQLDAHDNLDILRELVSPAHRLQTGMPDLVWASNFRTSWSVDSGDGRFLQWRGRALNCWWISLNTAVALGGEVLRFAAHLAAQADIHAWVDGPDRAWCAEVIEEGLEVGILRRQLHHHPIGWDGVVELLRTADDGPVVTSYSVEEWFPNPTVAGFRPQIPDGWRPDGWSELEWAELDESERDDYRSSRVGELFNDLGDAEQWRFATAALRARASAGLQIRPSEPRFHFGPDISVFDLLSEDRDQRLDAAFAQYDAAFANSKAD